MKDKQCIDAIHSGHFLYWDMLGRLRGAVNHKEDGLRWLSGDIDYNYYCDTADAGSVVACMENNEIPKTLTFLADSDEAALIKPYRATGRFKETMRATGMAHKLAEAVPPTPDKWLSLFRVCDITQLKMAGSILNSVFEYRLFSLEKYIEMMGNAGQFFYLAEYDSLPVGACMAQHGDGFINISWVGVLPGYRKLGIAGCLIHAAERDGFRQGKTIGVLHGFPKAVGAYRRIGYQEYCVAIVLELQ